MASAMMSTVTQFIRENYSSEGLDVVRTADSHIVCALPEEVVDLGGITETLESRFGCLVDMRQSKNGEGFELVVHISGEAEPTCFSVEQTIVPTFEAKRTVAKLMGVLAAVATIYIAMKPSIDSRKAL